MSEKIIVTAVIAGIIVAVSSMSVSASKKLTDSIKSSRYRYLGGVDE